MKPWLMLYEAGARVSVVNPAKISHYAKSLGFVVKQIKKTVWY